MSLKYKIKTNSTCAHAHSSRYLQKRLCCTPACLFLLGILPEAVLEISFSLSQKISVKGFQKCWSLVHW